MKFRSAEQTTKGRGEEEETGTNAWLALQNVSNTFLAQKTKEKEGRMEKEESNFLIRSIKLPAPIVFLTLPQGGKKKLSEQESRRSRARKLFIFDHNI